MVDNLKLVLVGDTGVGKSSLAFAYGSGTFPAGFKPVFNGINNTHDMILGDDTPVTIEILIAPSESSWSYYDLGVHLGAMEQTNIKGYGV